MAAKGPAGGGKPPQSPKSARPAFKAAAKPSSRPAFAKAAGTPHSASKPVKTNASPKFQPKTARPMGMAPRGAVGTAQAATYAKAGKGPGKVAPKKDPPQVRAQLQTNTKSKLRGKNIGPTTLGHDFKRSR